MNDLDKTMAPHRGAESSGADEVTMPGKRDRKPDGRFAVGDLIMGRYKVLAELGQGGMGVVYRCLDETAGIEVALKAIPPELSHNTLEMEDIKDNFQLVAKLVHQNIAISKNLERDNSNGNYYLIMECCEGEDLRSWIRRKRKEGNLTLEDVLPIITQVADALDYAHKQKIIHRDIKPGNIMIAANGDIKVLDFGLAAQIHTSMTRVSMAYHGTSGTGPYMAPEQWRGRAQGAAADQYALAVMTYEMLAGHLPFESSDAVVLREAVLNDTPECIPGISETVQNAVKRAMEKEPAERFDTCSTFVVALKGKKKKQNTCKPIIFGLYLKLINGCQRCSKYCKLFIGMLILVVLSLPIVSAIKKNILLSSNITLSLPYEVKLELIKIKAGTFTMGSQEGEVGRERDERAHRVILTKDFWLGKFEVTQNQYEAIMGNNPSFHDGFDCPVERVYWQDAKRFCNILNEKYKDKLPPGYKFDLPTEAQWEYACRAGTETALNNGKNLTNGYKCENLTEIAWYKYSEKESQTHPVGQKHPNVWGVYDMHGNVKEWCRDTYDSCRGSFNGTATDPCDDRRGSGHRVRGGGWKSPAWQCRSASRDREFGASRDNDIGFRVAIVPIK